MAEADEDIEIVVEGAEVPEIVVEQAPEKGAADEVVKAAEIDPEEGLRALKANLERETSARLAAEQRAREAGASELKARTEVQDTNLTLVTNAIATVKQSTDILKAKYTEAMTVGDYGAAADIQSDMATNAAKLLQLEHGKTALEQAPKPVSTDRRIEDPVEKLASQLSGPSAAWVRAHPQYATNDRMFHRMIAAHNLAESEPDSPEYFVEIERTLGITPRAATRAAQETDNALSGAAAATQSRSPPAAPVTRNGGGPGARPNVGHLSALEREMAANMGMTEQEYGKNKAALQREGKLH